MVKRNLLYLSGAAILLSMGGPSRLSASSVFDIPLPTQCVNEALLGGCPQGATRYNVSVNQQTLWNQINPQSHTTTYMGDVVAVPTTYSEWISSLTLFVAAPQNWTQSDVQALAQSLDLYLGYVGDDLSGTLYQENVTSDQVWQSGYRTSPTGPLTPYQEVSPNTGTYDNVWAIELKIPWGTGQGAYWTDQMGNDCSSNTFNGINYCYYGWAVTTTNGSFTPLVSFLDRPQDANFYGSGAMAYFTNNGSPNTLNVFDSTLQSGQVSGLNYPPSVDFIANPEPSSIALFAAGLGLLGLKLRRRK